jgi:hypothetical protein
MLNIELQKGKQVVLFDKISGNCCVINHFKRHKGKTCLAISAPMSIKIRNTETLYKDTIMLKKTRTELKRAQ